MSGVEELGRRAKAASRILATAPTATKNAALLTAADLLLERAGEIQAANDADLEAAAAGGMEAGPLDRLRLTDARLTGMAEGLRTVAALADPIGEVIDGWTPPNGLQITRVRVPLGVVAIIYENRPNVTSDAAGLCVKSGNAALLRGSSSALRSNIAIVSVLRDALAKHGLPEDAVLLVEDVAYETATQVMQLVDYVDCLIPRGGPSLIQSVRDNATVPVIIDGYVATAAAAILKAANPSALDHCLIGHVSGEPGHIRAIEKLGKTPLLALGMRLGEGTGAALAAGIVKAAAACHSGMATFAQAGVSNKE